MAELIHVSGLVQGVGFRPFVFRLANRLGVRGWVENCSDGVWCLAEAEPAVLDAFARALRVQAPAAALVRAVERQPSGQEAGPGFRIVPSQNDGPSDTWVSPDIAVCDDCLRDMREQPRRLGHPLVNCTHCGPRYTIIRALPYDRPNTTLASFPLCPDCQAEYADPSDRRFHAQPIACNRCGPRYALHRQGLPPLANLEELLALAGEMLAQGKVLVVKGMGGYHLACAARSAEAVGRLRALKGREAKPFAVMFRDREAVERHAWVRGPEEAELLLSWRRPIVLLAAKEPLPVELSGGFSRVGAFLPYMPFHHQLFEASGLDALVMTSANATDEPLEHRDERALSLWLGKVDAVLAHDRPIQNRLDDSVAMVAAGGPRVLRRARGYVPMPIELPFSAEGLLAVGAELANAFCLGRGRQAFLGPHLGDLKNWDTQLFFEEAFGRFADLFGFRPRALVCDAHPDYLSSRWAQRMAKAWGLPLLEVWHHHAHVAACMAEHGLDEPVLGLALDGLGLGPDGSFWGGELLVGGFAGFERLGHLSPLALPGGDMASRQPWRMALSALRSALGDGRAARELLLSLAPELSAQPLEAVAFGLERGINSPMSSSCGRIFDAAASLLGLAQVSGFHAEAPMRVEEAARRASPHGWALPWDRVGPSLDFRPALLELAQRRRAGEEVGFLARAFHNSLCEGFADLVSHRSADLAIRKIAFGGGVFQNAMLCDLLVRELGLRGFEVFLPSQVPANDGGLALGQLAIGAKRLEFPEKKS